MLAWTPAGAVTRPRTLQIRLTRAYPDRVPAGAPVPTRALTTDEVADTLRRFTTASTRAQPVDALVLSGQGVPTRADLPALVALARARGIMRVTLHSSLEDLVAPLPAVPGVDRYVLPVRLGPGGSDAAALATALSAARAAGLVVDANLPLSTGALATLPDAVRVALDGGVASVTFTYPFPTGGTDAPPSVADAVAALARAVPLAESAGVPVVIKGLPACWLGPLARHLRRSANRWYVDADHQGDDALLFFPGVVAFAKGDPCRFCAADATCDGPSAAWAGRPGNPPLRPVEGPEAR